ncbi:hypothetical protein V9J15_03925 [Candidatus Liberibacter africanus]|uniref:Transmembrane protein n=1 Tax=Candidatus Liberibacter africanus PTSAPSY TaxID=1277257 RepID=A0A0G3I3B2_LIBAF|nr:hypothetical protein [Candidatus Liberibacter africanus]AKK19730.1 hypothetical protein G293_00375 [Candidatus Liberibacter africanus PTSAPSY]
MKEMNNHLWIAVDVFVIVATVITCFFMNKQFSWWLRIFLPFLLIIIMIVHIACLIGYMRIFAFPPF